MPKQKLNAMEAMMQQLRKELRAQGITVTELGPSKTGRLQANFIPRPRQSKPKRECPRCLWTSTLDHLGRCRACWGDVFGLCEECGSILEENRSCSICSGEDKSNDQAD